MADNDEGAIKSGSPAGSEEDSPSSGGNHSQKSPEQLLSEYQAENKRKAEEIKSLKETVSSYNERISELEELAKDRNLTNKEENELSKLNTNVNELVNRFESNNNDEYSTAVKGLIEKKSMTVAEKKALELIFQNECERQEDFLNDKVDELNSSLKEDEEKFTFKSLSQLLFPYGQSYTHLRPERKAQLAFRDWKKSNESEKNVKLERSKLEQEKREWEKFRETGRHTARDKSLDDKFSETKDKGLVMVDVMDQAAKLRKE